MLIVSGKFKGKPIAVGWEDGSVHQNDLEFLNRLHSVTGRVGLTPEGPFYEPGFATKEQAYATIVAALDRDFDPVAPDFEINPPPREKGVC